MSDSDSDSNSSSSSSSTGDSSTSSDSSGIASLGSNTVSNNKDHEDSNSPPPVQLNVPADNSEECSTNANSSFNLTTAKASADRKVDGNIADGGAGNANKDKSVDEKEQSVSQEKTPEEVKGDTDGKNNDIKLNASLKSSQSTSDEIQEVSEEGATNVAVMKVALKSRSEGEKESEPTTKEMEGKLLPTVETGEDANATASKPKDVGINNESVSHEMDEKSTEKDNPNLNNKDSIGKKGKSVDSLEPDPGDKVNVSSKESSDKPKEKTAPKEAEIDKEEGEVESDEEGSSQSKQNINLKSDDPARKARSPINLQEGAAVTEKSDENNIKAMASSQDDQTGKEAHSKSDENSKTSMPLESKKRKTRSRSVSVEKRKHSKRQHRSKSRNRRSSSRHRRRRSRSRSRSRSLSRGNRRSRDRSASRSRRRRSSSLERRREERKRRHAEREEREAETNANNDKQEDKSTEKGSDKNEQPKASTENDNATVTDPKAQITERQRRTVDLLTSRTGGAYIPPAKLRMMQAEITDKSSAAYQRIAWEALKKSIHGYINKVNVDNIAIITRELLKENIVRGRGLLCRSIIQAQAASPTFTHVYAALVAIINSKFPNIGELLLRRLAIQFKRAFRRNDKAVCLSSTRFIAHLINQRVAHEVLALEILTLLVEQPTDDSVEVAIGFLKECGMKLTELSSKGIGAIFEMLKNILHEGKLEKRVQYMIEVVFQVRKDGFRDHQSVIDALELVEEEDQFTHMMMLDDAKETEDILNVFKYDEQYENNEEKYKDLSKDILGSDASDSDGSSGSGSDSDSSDSDETNEEKATAGDIIDNTETNLIALRRTIYLTINSSLDYEECAHKLMKMQLKPGQEPELCHMFLDCCAEQRTYEKFYGLLAQRFCSINKIYIQPFEEIFRDTYQTTHRLDTNRLRNVSKFFAHLLFTDAISWDVLECIKLNEDDTTSSSRIFIKILFQELAEYMGLGKLNAKLKDEVLAISLSGLFPRDNPRNTRFSINFFTSIGLGGLTDDLRNFLKNSTRVVSAEEEIVTKPSIQEAPAGSSSSSSSASSGSSSESDSSSSSSSSSSSESSSSESDSDSSDSDNDKNQKKRKASSSKRGKGKSKHNEKGKDKKKSKTSKKKVLNKRKRRHGSSEEEGSSSSSDSTSDDSDSSQGSKHARKGKKKDSSSSKRDSKKKSQNPLKTSEKPSKKPDRSSKRRDSDFEDDKATQSKHYKNHKHGKSPDESNSYRYRNGEDKSKYSSKEKHDKKSSKYEDKHDSNDKRYDNDRSSKSLKRSHEKSDKSSKDKNRDKYYDQTENEDEIARKRQKHDKDDRYEEKERHREKDFGKRDDKNRDRGNDRRHSYDRKRDQDHDRDRERSYERDHRDHEKDRGYNRDHRGHDRDRGNERDHKKDSRKDHKDYKKRSSSRGHSQSRNSSDKPHKKHVKSKHSRKTSKERG